MTENALTFESSLTLEEIEANFANVDSYEQIMDALQEALEYERASHRGMDRNYFDDIYYTASIIDTRNKLLSDTNLSEWGLRKPEKNYGGSNINEYNDLHSLLTETYTKFGESRYTHLYYPLVSGCYAYQPIYNSTILEKYKAHNWFVPTAGDILRIGYYLYKYYHDSDHENNFFKEAKMLQLERYGKWIQEFFSSYTPDC